jgi:hypothetical protein
MYTIGGIKGVIIMKNLFPTIVQAIDYDLIPGISIEIRDCLKGDNEVLEYSVVTNEDKSYGVFIKLKEFDVLNAKNVFMNLLEFIEYTSVFYVRNDDEHRIEYFLLSTSENGLAFYCQITFH